MKDISLREAKCLYKALSVSRTILQLSCSDSTSGAPLTLPFLLWAILSFQHGKFCNLSTSSQHEDHSEKLCSSLLLEDDSWAPMLWSALLEISKPFFGDWARGTIQVGNPEPRLAPIAVPALTSLLQGILSPSTIYMGSTRYPNELLDRCLQALPEAAQAGPDSKRADHSCWRMYISFAELPEIGPQCDATY